LTGAQTYGYRLVRRGEHTEREIDAAQAAVVRRVYELAAEGRGYNRITHALAADGPAPGRRGWTKDIVNRMLRNELYRGVAAFGMTRSVDRAGQAGRRERVRPDEWVRADVPHLRLVSDDLWARVQARKAKTRAHYLAGAGRPPARQARVRPRGVAPAERHRPLLVLRRGAHAHGQPREPPVLLRGAGANYKAQAQIETPDMQRQAQIETRDASRQARVGEEELAKVKGLTPPVAMRGARAEVPADPPSDHLVTGLIVAASILGVLGLGLLGWRYAYRTPAA
jgi:hypothetical protein